jgi:hypothetical protein
MFLQLLDEFRMTLEMFRKIRRGDSSKTEKTIFTAGVKNLRSACVGAATDFAEKFAILFQRDSPSSIGLKKVQGLCHFVCRSEKIESGGELNVTIVTNYVLLYVYFFSERETERQLGQVTQEEPSIGETHRNLGENGIIRYMKGQMINHFFFLTFSTNNILDG